jgi:hypothetical protein
MADETKPPDDQLLVSLIKEIAEKSGLQPKNYWSRSSRISPKLKRKEKLSPLSNYRSIRCCSKNI